MSARSNRDFVLEPADNERPAHLSGPFDEHLRQIELRLRAEIANRGHSVRVIGEPPAAHAAERVLRALYEDAGNEVLSPHKVHLLLQESGIEETVRRSTDAAQDVAIKVKRGTIKGRGPNQARYLQAVVTHDINFGIGPAGTGKPFLAVACAVEALNEGK